MLPRTVVASGLPFHMFVKLMPNAALQARAVPRPPTPDPLSALEYPFHTLVAHSCTCLLDHLIRQDEERWGERDPERLRRLAVEDQLELHGLFHGQVGRFGAFEQAIHIVGDAAQRVARAVRTS